MSKFQVYIIINNIGEVVETIPKLSLQFQCSHVLEKLELDRSVKQWHKATNTHSG